MRNFELPGRSPVYSVNGMAATSHPLATLTAVNILKEGGNAMDAAVAACAMHCVVEPQSIGIGGDCFALFSPKGSNRVIAYNGSGRTPAAAELERLIREGYQEIPRHSPHAVTIPGAVDAWFRLIQDFGSKPFGDLFEPAIRVARNGYPVHPRVAADWQRWVDTLSQDPTTSRIFLPDGKTPEAGALHSQPLLAETLLQIADKGRDAFYEGPIARDIVEYLNELGGVHTLDDFASACGEYVDPIQVNYRGYDVFECPPNGQGLSALIMLNMLEGFNFSHWDPLSAKRLHLEIEAAKLAYQDRDAYISDPHHTNVPVSRLLSESHANDLRKCIDMNKSMERLPRLDLPRHGDTVYLCVVDQERNAVSFINSLFTPFGSGLASPNTGVLLQNRGIAFSLNPDHPNCFAPSKRPLHTIIPGMLLKDGKAVMPFGVMGGQYQAAGHVHFLTNFIDFQLDIQESIDFGRVFPLPNGQVEVESGIPLDVVKGLQNRGHMTCSPGAPIGGGQAIWIDWERGVLTGGSDPRKDGCALGY
jgi:gamma-glutamyltranspeptidase/glutathione hydrolase